MGKEYKGSILGEMIFVFILGFGMGLLIEVAATNAGFQSEPTIPSGKVLVDPYECQTVYAPDTTKLLFCTTNSQKD